MIKDKLLPEKVLDMEFFSSPNMSTFYRGKRERSILHTIIQMTFPGPLQYTTINITHFPQTQGSILTIFYSMAVDGLCFSLISLSLLWLTFSLRAMSWQQS